MRPGSAPYGRCMRAVLTVVMRVLVVGSVLAAAPAAGLFGVAAVELRHGPSAPGYTALAHAVEFTIATAALVAAAAAVAAWRGQRSLRTRGFVLLLSSGFTGVIAASAVTIGRTMATFHPTEQPAGLNSLILALEGVGHQLLAVPVVLSVGALLVWASALRRRPVAA
jgi:hypothetical protein